MDSVQLAIEHGPYLTLAVASYVSAVFPLVNAELIVAGLAAILPNPHLFVLITIATAAQMAGKSTMYWAGRRASAVAPDKYARAIERWGSHFKRSPRSAAALVFVSSASGLPPFYAISTLAGLFGTSFVAFIVIGTVGRFLHFTLVSLIPVAFLSIWR